MLSNEDHLLEEKKSRQTSTVSGQIYRSMNQAVDMTDNTSDAGDTYQWM